MMKKTLFILIVVIVFSGWMTQVDDDLSEEAVSLLERIDPDATSEAYFYLYGIFARDGENPAEVGKSLFAEYQTSVSDDSYHVDGYPKTKKLPLPEGAAFCQLQEAGCLEYLFSHAVNVERLLSEHRVLLSRSQAFLEFDEYKTLAKPSPEEPLPPYRYITAAERIKVLDAISAYNRGNARKAIDSLMLQFTTLRKAQALQDNITGKITFLMSLSDIIDVTSVILSREGLEADRIPGFTPSEKSFDTAIVREFKAHYDLFKGVDKHPEFFRTGGNVPGWYTRIFFKPNMTINAITSMHYRTERLAKLSPSAFASEIETLGFVPPSTSTLRNHIGNVLINVLSGSGYDKYVARFHDVDAKLALFNQRHHLTLEPGDMKNPYYGDEVPRENDGSYCFSGPLNDESALRCLRVNI
ncbi:hypothetical protein [Endozoicomonas elysicola]|uniref:Uncharacterized protein n=1 Tax=Endozoicomonas elysicola TaxID=305900 RepID=A0A081KAU4_9GAMM|nr:hypothetical protein [Endozoicomonas elysicola]KEI71270.1 hypothetical protein GV64_11415 [Endozoicomonas elysicola]